MIKPLLLWLIVGVVVSFVFFKFFDRMSKNKPEKYLSVQDIIKKSARVHSETPDGEILLKIVISSTIAVGGVVVWPLVFIPLWHLIRLR